MLIKDKPMTTIAGAEDITKVFKEVYNLLSKEDKHKEVVYVAGLDNRNRILYIDLVTFGTVNHASPVIRETLRQAIIRNAVSIIVCHNHPSGSSTPGPDDNSFTKKLKNACDVLGINLLDHIILGDYTYSYADEGKL